MAEQQRERDIAEMEAQMAHDTDQYFEARPQIMRTRDKETTFEAGFKAAWAARPLSHAGGEVPNVYWVLFDATADKKFIKKSLDDGSLAFFDTEQEASRAKARHTGTDYMRVEYYKHPAPQLAGLTETAIKSSPAYRKLHREKDHLLGLLKEQAPQVAVPAGYTLVPEDMLTHFRDFHDAVKTLSKTADPDGYWEHQCEVCKRIESQLAAAPTAPAGEPEKPRINVGSVGHVEQPVSDPDGLPEGWEIGIDGHGDMRVSGIAERLATGRHYRETVWLGPEPENPELWLFRKLCDQLTTSRPAGREVAAKAINDAAQHAQDWIEKQGAVTPQSTAALDAVQAYANSLEKKS